MKSIFLSLVVLVSLTAGQVFAQAKKPVRKQTRTSTSKTVKPIKKVTTSVSTPAPVAVVEKTSFDKFYERLGISYFGAYTSANLQDGDYSRAALSPEFSGGSNEDSYAQNLFNQLNFAYNFGAKLKFNLIPRWTVFLSHPSDQDPGDRGMVILEDALMGFSGVLYTSDDKKFSWWTNPRMRLPTSHATRHGKNKEFGTLTYQLEWNNSFSYNFNEKWNVGLSIGNRVYIYENRYNWSRHRITTNPSVAYSINDTTKIQAYYEHMLQNNRNWKSINGKEPKYEDLWQNFMIGVSHDITPKLNVLPFVSTFINDVPYSMQSYWLGLWVSYTIK